MGVAALVAVVATACLVTPPSGEWLDGTVSLGFTSPPAGYSASQPGAAIYSGDTVESLYGTGSRANLGLTLGNYLFVWTGEIGVAGPVRASAGQMEVEVGTYPTSCYDVGTYAAFAIPWNTPVPEITFTYTSLACPS